MRFAWTFAPFVLAACSTSLSAPVHVDVVPIPDSPSLAIERVESRTHVEPAPAIGAPPTEIEPIPEPRRAFAEPPVARERTRVTVLLYHMFSHSMTSELAVDPAAFDAQLDWLAEHRVTVVSTADLLRFLDGDLELPERVAVITIDDGHTSVFARAFPILKRHVVPFAIALNTAAIEGGRREAVKGRDVREMLSSGLCEIASHSHIHGHMDRLTIDADRREAELSRSILETRTGVRPEAFVFPFGANDDRSRRVVEEAGYRAAFAAWGGDVDASSPRFKLPRVSVLRSTTSAAFAKLFEGSF